MQRFRESQRQGQVEECRRGEKRGLETTERKSSKDRSRDGESESVLGLTKWNLPICVQLPESGPPPVKVDGAPRGLQSNPLEHG